jgi:heat shock protein HslJ
LILTLSGCQQHLPNQKLTHQNMAHQSSANNTIPSGLASADLGSASSIEQNATTPSTNTHSSTTHQGLSGLTEITWQQVLPSDINRSAAISPRPLVQNRPYLRFNQRDQRFSGNDGCNQIMGTYQATANSLKLSAIVSTRRACLSGDDLNNGGFVKALSATQSYQLEQDRLLLLDQQQQVLLTFSKSITQ